MIPVLPHSSWRTLTSLGSLPKPSDGGYDGLEEFLCKIFQLVECDCCVLGDGCDNPQRPATLNDEDSGDVNYMYSSAESVTLVVLCVTSHLKILGISVD